MDGYRHLELYYAVSGSGAVLHTLNPRLHPDQLVWIANDAEDQVLFFDLSFLPQIEAIASRAKTIKVFVAMTDRAHMPAVPATGGMPNLLCYEDLIAGASDEFDWPVFDENTAASLCYTSGRLVIRRARCTATAQRSCTRMGRPCPTRSIVRRATPSCRWSRCSTSTPGACRTSRAWSAPSSFFPGHGLTGKSLHDLIENEGVTLTAGVPTVWQGLLTHVRSQQSEVQQYAPHRYRRRGVPAGNDARVSGPVRRAGAARLGHDRVEPARHCVHAQGGGMRA